MQSYINFETKNIYYEQELYYYRKRLIVLGGLIAVTLIILYSFQSQSLHDMLLQYIFCLIGLLLLSLAHISIVHHHPDSLLVIRKIIPIAIDITLLTYFLIIFGDKGVFLLLFYTLIVMHAGFNLGENYFYATLFFSFVSWGIVLYFSPYWQEHYAFLATFAIITFLIPFFYLEYITEIHHDREALNSILEDVSHHAKLDPLTGAYNRKSYQEIGAYFIEGKTLFALFYIDLNHFKPINDTYGHAVGDKVLQEVTHRMEELLTENDMLVRLGGDEFAIFLSRRMHSVHAFIDELRKSISQPIHLDDIILDVDLSIGISLYPEDGGKLNDLTSFADKAMYYAKKRRMHYCFYKDIALHSHIS